MTGVSRDNDNEDPRFSLCSSIVTNRVREIATSSSIGYTL